MIIEDMFWQQRGACVGKDGNLFIPPDGETKAELHRRTQTAMAICAECPADVKEACLAFAVRVNEIGIWGGTTARQRRRMRETANA